MKGGEKTAVWRISFFAVSTEQLAERRRGHEWSKKKGARRAAIMFTAILVLAAAKSCTERIGADGPAVCMEHSGGGEE